jgi:hypothetical protein
LKPENIKAAERNGRKKSRPRIAVAQSANAESCSEGNAFVSDPCPGYDDVELPIRFLPFASRRFHLYRAVTMKNAFSLTCAAMLFCSAPAVGVSVAQQPRYLAVFADGSRVEGAKLVGWHDATATPTLSGVNLQDVKRPMRWLRDRTIPLADLSADPTGWVELVGGDRLPGRVVGAEDAATDGTGVPACLLVEPGVAVHLPDDEPAEHVRVLARYVQRVVWSDTSQRQLQPGTLFYRSGARLKFRSLRWDQGSVLLLLDGGTRSVSLADVAEVHCRRRDPWQAYCDELAVLSPQCRDRLMRIETGRGLIVTGSRSRFRAAAFATTRQQSVAMAQLTRLDEQIKQHESRRAEAQDRLNQAQAKAKQKTAELLGQLRAAEKASRDAIDAKQKAAEKQRRNDTARWAKAKQQLDKQLRDAEKAKVKQLAKTPLERRDKQLKAFRKSQATLRKQREQKIEQDRLRSEKQRASQFDQMRRQEEIKLRNVRNQLTRGNAATDRAVAAAARSWKSFLDQTERLKQRRAVAHNRLGGPDTWYHMLQPAWSPDPLWMPFHAIAMRWSFAPHEVPLVRIHPTEVQHHSAIGTDSSWRANRNLEGRALRSGGQTPGWGFAVQGRNQMAFDLPESAVSFRARFGLDDRAGDGGCVRVRLLIDSPQPNSPPKPLYESPFIVGSRKITDTGALDVRGAKGPARQLILQVDDAHAGRPAGADPLDIRDLLNWFDPLLLLDPAMLKSQVHARAGSAVFAWRGWSLRAESDNAFSWSSIFDRSGDSRGARFLPTVRAERQPLILSRPMTPGASDEYLVIDVSTGAGEPPPRGAVRLHIGAAEIIPRPLPPRQPWQSRPAPLVFLIAPHQDKKVELRLTQAIGDKPLCWRAISTADQLPPMYQLADALKAAGKADLEAPEALGRILESGRVSRNEKVAAIKVHLSGGILNFTNPALGGFESDLLDRVLIGADWKGGDRTLVLLKQLVSLKRLMIARDVGLSEAAIKDVKATLPELARISHQM